MSPQIKQKYLSEAVIIPSVITFFLGVVLTAFTDSIVNKQAITDLTKNVGALTITIDQLSNKRDADQQRISDNTGRIIKLEATVFPAKINLPPPQ